MAQHGASSSDKTMQFQARGADRERYLDACLERIAQWGLKMPEREVLLLDFGLGEFQKTGLVEFWVANEDEAGYCGKFLFVFDGQTCPAHRHNVKHETFYVVKGSVEMVSGAVARILNEGDVHVVCRGTVHSFTGRGDALLLEVSTPCLLADNVFEDKRVGDDGVI